MFNLISTLFFFIEETNSDAGEKPVRLKIIDMDDIDEDTTQTGKCPMLFFLNDINLLYHNNL